MNLRCLNTDSILQEQKVSFTEFRTQEKNSLLTSYVVLISALLFWVLGFVGSWLQNLDRGVLSRLAASIFICCRSCLSAVYLWDATACRKLGPLVSFTSFRKKPRKGHPLVKQPAQASHKKDPPGWDELQHFSALRHGWSGENCSCSCFFQDNRKCAQEVRPPLKAGTMLAFQLQGL